MYNVTCSEVAMEKNKNIIPARISLVCAPLIWGISFVFVKDITSVIGTNLLLAIRFISASLLLSLVYHKKLRMLNPGYIVNGAVIGALLYAAYSFQTYGIKYTTPGKNAFITGTYVVLVPFIHWIISKKRPTLFNLLAALLSIMGIGAVSLDSGFDSINIGDILTLVCGVFFAIHIVFVNRFTENKDPFLLTIVQFAFSGIFAGIGCLFTHEGFYAVPGAGDIITIIYLAVLCTAVALLMQTYGQKYTPPALASVILCLESAFGFLFSVIMGREQLTVKLVIGFLLVFLATLICEVRIKK